jgi:hypothetical protein
VEAAWGVDRVKGVREAADDLARAFGDPRDMTRDYHVYLAAGLPMPRYALDEFVWFMKSGTEKAAGRKMTPEVEEWLREALVLLDELPSSPG